MNGLCSNKILYKSVAGGIWPIGSSLSTPHLKEPDCQVKKSVKESMPYDHNLHLAKRGVWG